MGRTTTRGRTVGRGRRRGRRRTARWLRLGRHVDTRLRWYEPGRRRCRRAVVVRDVVAGRRGDGHADADARPRHPSEPTATPRRRRRPPPRRRRPPRRRSHARASSAATRGPKVLALQRRLSELGYWLGEPDGTFGSLTQQAVYALQKSAGIGRDGVVGPKTKRALEQGVRPRVTLSGDGVEIVLERQLLVVVRDGRASTILNTSTGQRRGVHDHLGQPGHRDDAQGQLHRLPRGRRPADELARRAVAPPLLPPRLSPCTARRTSRRTPRRTAVPG